MQHGVLFDMSRSLMMATEIHSAEQGEAEGCIQCQKGSKLVLFEPESVTGDVILVHFLIIDEKVLTCLQMNEDAHHVRR